ncbi:MAG TPA: nickel-binding protein [Candidatus Dormibacteraeota bacterium]|nr:nickel-binding protein [Candidatus Dormibacteraeota bacterium]
MARFMLESYPVGISSEQLAAALMRAADVAAQLRVSGIEIRIIESTLVPAEDSLFCIFDAPSRKVVEDVVTRSGLPFERLVEVVDVGPAAGRSQKEA